MKRGRKKRLPRPPFGRLAMTKRQEKKIATPASGGLAMTKRQEKDEIARAPFGSPRNDRLS